jgi:hypothetical protein
MRRLDISYNLKRWHLSEVMLLQVSVIPLLAILSFITSFGEYSIQRFLFTPIEEQLHDLPLRQDED